MRVPRAAFRAPRRGGPLKRVRPSADGQRVFVISRWVALLVLGLAPWAPGQGAPAQEPHAPPPAGDDIAGLPFVDLGPPDLVREELFELRRGPADAGPTAGAEGWARLVTSRRPGEWEQVELELGLFAGELVLHQVERRGEDSRELVYRERRPNHGRTLRVQWRGSGDGAEMERVEWAGRDRLHRRARGTVPETPLLAAEFARRGDAPVGERALYWPPADRVEALGVRRHGVGGAVGIRLVTWQDGRGDLVQWRLFGGPELLAFGFGQGGLVAWRASEERVGALRARFAPDVTPRQP